MQDQTGGVEAAQRAGAGEREERIVLHLLLAELLGVVDEDHPAVGVDVVAQDLHPFLEEEHHGGVVVLAAAIGPAVEEVADRVDAEDVRRRIRERGLNRTRHAHAALVVEQHLQLRRGDEGVACGRQHLWRQGDLLQPFAQIVILDLGLQIEDPQRPRRGEAEKRHACGHVHEPGDQQVALADLGRAAQHEKPTRRQHAWRDDVLGHGALVVQQRAQREGGHLDRPRCAGIQPDQGRPVFLDMPVPEPLGLALEPFDRPLRPQHGGVVAADALPALVLRHPALVDHADEMPDRGRRALEAGPVVRSALTHRGDQHIVHRGLVRVA